MLTVRVASFSFHGRGIPRDHTGNGGGFVFDCRCLPNPGRIPDFMRFTGRDEEIIEFLEAEESVRRFLSSILSIVDLAIGEYTTRSFSDLMVSFGCTGGLHRSVYCADRLAEHLRKRGIAIRLEHRELGIRE